MRISSRRKSYSTSFFKKKNLADIFDRWRGGTPDKEVFNTHIEKLSARLDVYDDILSKQKYVAGNVRVNLGFGADYELRILFRKSPSQTFITFRMDPCSHRQGVMSSKRSPT